uniref:Uncharacterized protein n=1 Tax=Musca domestica TaxID=7370 RepID=A0A1I8MP52_MUSDO
MRPKSCSVGLQVVSDPGARGDYNLVPKSKNEKREKNCGEKKTQMLNGAQDIIVNCCFCGGLRGARFLNSIWKYPRCGHQVPRCLKNACALGRCDNFQSLAENPTFGFSKDMKEDLATPRHNQRLKENIPGHHENCSHFLNCKSGNGGKFCGQQNTDLNTNYFYCKNANGSVYSSSPSSLSPAKKRAIVNEVLKRNQEKTMEREQCREMGHKEESDICVASPNANGYWKNNGENVLENFANKDRDRSENLNEDYKSNSNCESFVKKVQRQDFNLDPADSPERPLEKNKTQIFLATLNTNKAKKLIKLMERYANRKMNKTEKSSQPRQDKDPEFEKLQYQLKDPKMKSKFSQQPKFCEKSTATEMPSPKQEYSLATLAMLKTMKIRAYEVGRPERGEKVGDLDGKEKGTEEFEDFKEEIGVNQALGSSPRGKYSQDKVKTKELEFGYPKEEMGLQQPPKYGIKSKAAENSSPRQKYFQNEVKIREFESESLRAEIVLHQPSRGAKNSPITEISTPRQKYSQDQVKTGEFVSENVKEKIGFQQPLKFGTTSKVTEISSLSPIYSQNKEKFKELDSENLEKEIEYQQPPKYGTKSTASEISSSGQKYSSDEAKRQGRPEGRGSCEKEKETRRSFPKSKKSTASEISSPKQKYSPNEAKRQERSGERCSCEEEKERTGRNSTASEISSPKQKYATDEAMRQESPGERSSCGAEKETGRNSPKSKKFGTQSTASEISSPKQKYASDEAKRQQRSGERDSFEKEKERSGRNSPKSKKIQPKNKEEENHFCRLSKYGNKSSGSENSLLEQLHSQDDTLRSKISSQEICNGESHEKGELWLPKNLSINEKTEKDNKNKERSSKYSEHPSMTSVSKKFHSEKLENYKQYLKLYENQENFQIREYQETQFMRERQYSKEKETHPLSSELERLEIQEKKKAINSYNEFSFQDGDFSTQNDEKGKQKGFSANEKTQQGKMRENQDLEKNSEFLRRDKAMAALDTTETRDDNDSTHIKDKLKERKLSANQEEPTDNFISSLRKPEIQMREKAIYPHNNSATQDEHFSTKSNEKWKKELLSGRKRQPSTHSSEYENITSIQNRESSTRSTNNTKEIDLECSFSVYKNEEEKPSLHRYSGKNKDEEISEKSSGKNDLSGRSSSQEPSVLDEDIQTTLGTNGPDEKPHVDYKRHIIPASNNCQDIIKSPEQTNQSDLPHNYHTSPNTLQILRNLRYFLSSQQIDTSEGEELGELAIDLIRKLSQNRCSKVNQMEIETFMFPKREVHHTKEERGFLHGKDFGNGKPSYDLAEEKIRPTIPTIQDSDIINPQKNIGLQRESEGFIPMPKNLRCKIENGEKCDDNVGKSKEEESTLNIFPNKTQLKREVLNEQGENIERDNDAKKSGDIKEKEMNFKCETSPFDMTTEKVTFTLDESPNDGFLYSEKNPAVRTPIKKEKGDGGMIYSGGKIDPVTELKRETLSKHLDGSTSENQREYYPVMSNIPKEDIKNIQNHKQFLERKPDPRLPPFNNCPCMLATYLKIMNI